MNPPWDLPFSWIKKKKVVAHFLIGYLGPPWNEGNRLKIQFLQCEHRLCAGARLASLLPGRILQRERCKRYVLCVLETRGLLQFGN